MTPWLQAARGEYQPAQRADTSLFHTDDKTDKTDKAQARVVSAAPAPASGGVLSVESVLSKGGIGASQADPSHRPDASQRPAQPPADTSLRQDEAFPYGFAAGGRPKTWTGKVVSLAEWRQLSEWDKHGSTGQHWNGRAGRWEPGGVA